MLVQWADHDFRVGEAVSDRPARVRASRRHRAQAAVTQPEHGDRLAARDIRPAFADWQFGDRPQPVLLRSPGHAGRSWAGTWGSVTTGSAVRNWPGVTSR